MEKETERCAAQGAWYDLNVTSERSGGAIPIFVRTNCGILTKLAHSRIVCEWKLSFGPHFENAIAIHILGVGITKYQYGNRLYVHIFTRMRNSLGN